MKKEDYYYPQNNIKKEDYPFYQQYMPQGYSERSGYWVSPKDNAFMLLVAGGASVIGNDGRNIYSDETPSHTAYLLPFLIDVHKVRRESYLAFLDCITREGGHHADWCHNEEPYHKSHVPDDWDKQKENLALPVTGVDWYDAWAYAQWAKKMLPTEAQWEKACYTQYIFSALKQGEWNVHNMLGKGWEWCLDSYREDYHKVAPRYEPLCSEKTEYKVTKGCIHNAALPLSRISFRNRYPLIHREETLGFRCIKRLDVFTSM
ncbi:MAG: SUMF1/EgtB/PvdO family nonheme iron enzyme [Candidatus Brocadiae bacterium]|nr:SUMF1/EgtB/PvdO family nonheme iron enzyme [Candidatus Brocadiia bacterium]